MWSCGDKKLFEHLLAGLCRGQNVVLLKQIDHPSRDTVIHRIKLSSYILVPRGQFTDNSLSSAGLQDRGLICYGTFRDLIKNLAGTI